MTWPFGSLPSAATSLSKWTAQDWQDLLDAIRAIGPITSGNVLSAAVTTFQTLPITFPASFFTVAPTVIAIPRTSADVVMQCAVASETTTGANIYFKRATAIATNIGWLAFQSAP